MPPQTPKSTNRVLIVDDSVDIHRLLKIRLRNEQVTIASAFNGEEGLDKAIQNPPDLILLDIDMPGLSGFDVLSKLKESPDTHDIPVVFLSGTCGSEEKVRGFDLGAVDFITKPFDMAELRARVRSTLRTRQLVLMLAQRAQIDGLTGLWNRAHLDQRLAEFISGADRSGKPISLILSDIDKFKNLNDTHGHPFGDHVLQAFAENLTEQVRECDIPCRYGGEEFSVILPECDIESAACVAERCRASLEAITWKGRDDLVVTASFGVVSLDMIEDQTPAALIAAADQALYEAKESGRNRVIIHGGRTTASLTDPGGEMLKKSA